MISEDTIAAIATPIGESGIGIVRMSGKESFLKARKIFQPSCGKKVNWKTPFKTHYGWIIDPESKELLKRLRRKREHNSKEWLR